MEQFFYVYLLPLLIVTITAKVDLYFFKNNGASDKDFWMFATLMPIFNIIIAYLSVLFAIFHMLKFLILWVPKNK